MLQVVVFGSLLTTLATAQDIRPDRTITLSTPNLQCAKCKVAVESALKQVKGVTEVTAKLPTRSIVITYDHHLTSAARLAAQVVAVKPVHGKPYESSLLLTADAITKEQADKLITELKGFKSPLDTEPVATVVVELEKKLILIAFQPVKLSDPKDRGTDVSPLVNAAKKTVPTVKPVAPAKESPKK